MTEPSGAQKPADHSVQPLHDHHDNVQKEVPEYLSGASLYLLLSGLLVACFTMALDISVVATGRSFTMLSHSLADLAQLYHALRIHSKQSPI